MIAYGASITGPEVYSRCAGVGIDRVREDGSRVFVHSAAGPVARTYNLILEEASACDGLEALVLVHQDAEIRDAAFARKLREALAVPDVEVVGCVGASGVESIAWWEGDVTWGSTTYRYGELDGGELSWGEGSSPPAAPGEEVDTLYGVLLALSPWAVRNIRFDEGISLLHGYDLDVCRQARAAGRKVLVSDLEVVHHHSLDLVTDTELWAEAHVRAAERWDHSTSGDPDGDAWRRRARAAEAKSGAVQLLVASRQYQGDAATKRDSMQLEEVTETASWRVTRPLRELNARRTAARRLV